METEMNPRTDAPLASTETSSSVPNFTLYASLCSGAGVMTAIYVVLYIQSAVLGFTGSTEPSESIFKALQALSYILQGSAVALSIIAWRKKLNHAVPVLAFAAYFLLISVWVLSLFN